MRVAMLLTEYPVRSETFIEDQISGLRDLGCEITILPMRGGPTPEAKWKRLFAATGKALQLGSPARIPWRAANVFRHGEYAASLRLFCEAADLVSSGRQTPFDVVHAHFGPNGIRASMLRETGCLQARRWITSFYGYDVSSFPKQFRRNPYAGLFAEGDLFLPLSHAMRKRLIELGAPPDRMQVHSLGVNPELFHPRSEAPSTTGLHVLSIGRLVEKKGFADALRAVAASPSVHRYSILGDGPLRPSLERMIRDLGIQQRVKLLGWQDRQSVTAWLREADVFLAPSVTAADGDEEGTPTVILEAMACAIPVVATRHAGIPEVVIHGHSGLLAGEHDIPALRQAMETLAATPALRAEMGANGRQTILDRHDIRKLNRTLLSYYSA
jgi:colanic acid/amylovoran biosynthesis glycosyltransferase